MSRILGKSSTTPTLSISSIVLYREAFSLIGNQLKASNTTLITSNLKKSLQTQFNPHFPHAHPSVMFYVFAVFATLISHLSHSPHLNFISFLFFQIKHKKNLFCCVAAKSLSLDYISLGHIFGGILFYCEFGLMLWWWWREFYALEIIEN